MTVSTIESTFTDEVLETFITARGEPEWLAGFRRSAWRAFGGLDWPNRRTEEWMRTDIRTFKLDKYAPPLGTTDAPRPPQTLLSEGVELAGASSSVNSRPAASHLKPQWARQGVLFGSLDTLLLEHEELLRPLLGRAFRVDYDKFSAMHAAFWSGGHLLYVPRGVVVDEPFHALAALTNGGVDLGHTLVVLEEGAQATVLFETDSQTPHDAGLHCGATELLLGPGSNLRYVQLQDWGTGVWHFAHQKAIVQRDATLQWTAAALGCRLSKVNQHVELAGPGASCQVNGVMFTEGKQHLAYHTLQHHAAPYCQSDFLYKAAQQDRSHTVWRGMIQVDQVAQKTNGYQRNDNLLLSDQARADSIPGLEIQADDVRCTHGSTTGKVDEELIFYAMCRGFTRREATRMIVSGFFQQIFDRITIDSVRDALGRAIAARVREYE
jgi:Fe-S cluster assembly protein SufD